MPGLFPSIFDYETLYTAYTQINREKLYQNEARSFAANLEENLISIQNDLIYKSYEIGCYNTHKIKGTYQYAVLPFRDKVVQTAVYNVLNPFFMRSYICESYGLPIEERYRAAANHLRDFLNVLKKEPKAYYFQKLTIPNYHLQIDHTVLIELLQRRIACRGVRWLLKKIVNSEDDALGLPLGTSARKAGWRDNKISLMLADIYLNALDNYAIRDLRIKYYVRFLDEIIILSNSVDVINYLVYTMEAFIQEKLRLILDASTEIHSIEYTRPSLSKLNIRRHRRKY